MINEFSEDLNSIRGVDRMEVQHSGSNVIAAVATRIIG